VYWAGTIFFMVTFLDPAVRASGPDGATVMQQIMRRRYLTVLPAVALVTIVSGLRLLWIVSAGFAAPWFHSSAGSTLTAGSMAAIVAFTIGVGLLRPAALRIGTLGQTMAQMPEGPERAAAAQEVQRLRARVTASARWVAALLGIAVVSMAVARYL
jgi:hypothetical protein